MIIEIEKKFFLDKWNKKKQKQNEKPLIYLAIRFLTI